MACKENAEKDCKSYPKCDGCGAHTTSKNLTFKHRFRTRLKEYKEGEYDNAAYMTGDHAVINEIIRGVYEHAYLAGPVVDRLHEFEKLGYEPEQLEEILKKYDDLRRRYSMYRLMAHSTFGNAVAAAKNYQDTDSLSTKRDDAVDTLYYLCKLAGDVENAQCDDINSMYPSMIYTKDGFRELYITNDKFKKMMDERIQEAILRPVNYRKVWITTTSSVKDDEIMKKLKETAEKIKKGFEDGLECPKKNPLVDFKHQFTATFKVADFDRPNKNNVILDEKVFDKTIKNYVTRDIDATRQSANRISPVSLVETNKAIPKIKKVLFNNPATIVFWSDGDKTVVKAQNGEPYDPEKGLAMAISKKALGNGNKWYNEFKKQLKVYEETTKIRDSFVDSVKKATEEWNEEEV